MSRIQTSLHGNLAGITDQGYGNELLGRILAHGVENNTLRALGSPFSVVQFNDFTGKARALDDEWTFTEGTDNTTSDGSVVVARNGEFLLTPGDSAGTVAADWAQLNTALQWRADSGNLQFQARVKLASLVSCSCFVGLTDTVALEQAVESSGVGNGITTTATDAVGFIFDSRMTSAKWWGVGVKADVDAVHFDTGVTPVAATYDVLRVEVSAAGHAIFFVNGRQIGQTMQNALSPAVLLTPSFGIRPLSAVAGKTMTIDYSYTAADRV